MSALGCMPLNVSLDAKLLNCKSLKPFSDTGGSRVCGADDFGDVAHNVSQLPSCYNPGFDAQARREPSNQRVVNGQERVMQQERDHIPLMPDSMGRVEVSSACPINDLPPELFSEILVYVIRPKKVLPFEELHAELTRLSLACGTWLQAVRRESRLWTSCQLRFDGGRYSPTPQLMAALAAFYARSGSLPLVLFITIQSYNNSEHGQFAALTDFIWAYAGRWDDLNLMTTADHGHEWAPSVIFRATEGAQRVNPFRNVTSFKYMHLVDGTGSEKHFPQMLRLREAFPMLRSLNIIVPEPSKFKFAMQYLLMPTLEKLTLAGYMGSAWDLHSILDQAPQLDYLDFDGIAAQRLFSVLTHSCLTTLRLRSPFIVTNEFGTLCMPSLASLGISNSLHDEEDKPFDASLVLSAIRQMVDRSACQLKELQWRDMCIGVKHTRTLLEMFPTLETLTIWDELKTFVAILKDLQETKSDNPTILPRLSNLVACVIGSMLTPRQQGKIKEQILPLMKREHRGSPVSVDTTSAGIHACSARIESTNISCWLNGVVESRKSPGMRSSWCNRNTIVRNEKVPQVPLSRLTIQPTEALESLPQGERYAELIGLSLVCHTLVHAIRWESQIVDTLRTV
ncbi:hypothetical protein BKA70DRAFT_1231638 [Coprinopsis sp. MPI-PUGE-AT-0042]|nr:hypothetical protein BKA70DRAFT_1231638 [Coprinopsis sp. MPI-PUGE-AT-0042]